MEDSIQIDVSVSSGDAEKSLNGLKSRVEELTKDISGLTVGSDEYNKKLKQLKAASNEYNKANVAIQASTQKLGDTMGQLSSIAGGVSGAFNSYIALAGLTADGNDEIVKSMQKVQAGMAVVQGFTSLGGALKNANLAFKALNATMAANPIGAVIVAVVTLTTALAAFAAANSYAQNEVDKTNRNIEAFNKSLDASRKSLEFSTKEMALLGKSEEEVLKHRRKAIEEMIVASEKESYMISQSIEKYKRLGKSSEDIDALKESMKAQLETTKSLRDEITNISREEYLLSIRRKIDAKEQAENDAKVYEAKMKAMRDAAEYEVKALEKAKALYYEYIANVEYQNMNLEEQREKIDGTVSSLSKELELLKERASTSEDFALLLDLEQKYNLALAERVRVNTELEELARSKVEREALELEGLSNLDMLKGDLETFKAELNMTNEELASSRINNYVRELDMLSMIINDETAGIDERISSQKKYNQVYTQLSNARMAADKAEGENKKKVLMAALDVASITLSGASELFKDNARAQKAIDVGQATINTFKSATVALASAPPPVNFALMAANIAAGIAQVASIIKTDVGDGGSSTANVPSISEVVPQVPEIQGQIIETHTNLDAYDREELNTSSRVYLVESDIHEAQGRRVEITNNTVL